MSTEIGNRRYQLRKRADAMEETRRGSVGPARTTISAVAERAATR